MRYYQIRSPALSFNGWTIALFLVLFWSFHYTVLDVLGISPLIILCMELLAVAFALISTGRRAFSWVTPLAGWCVFLALTIRNNYYLETNQLSRPVAYFLVFFLAYFLQFTDIWYSSLQWVMEFFVLEHFCLSWLFYFFPGFYRSQIIPLFPYITQRRLRSYQADHVLIGLTDHYSTSGIYFAIGCILFFSLWLAYKEKKRYFILFMLMLLSLMMTQKRGPLVFVMVAIVVSFFADQGIHLKSLLFFVIGSGVLAGTIVLLIQLIPQLGAVVDRFFNAGDNGRDALHRYAWELFYMHPVFGAGFGQYRNYSKLKVSSDTEYAAHNHYLQILSEMGVLGLTLFVLLLVAMLLLTFYAVFRIKRCSLQTSAQRQMLLFSLGMQVYFIGYGITGNPLYDVQCFIPYFILLAVPLSYLLSVEKEKPNDESRNCNVYQDG